MKRPPIKVMVYGDPTTGKCLGKGTPVMKSDGRIVPVETIVPGDRLMGPNGEPKNVLAVNAGVGLLYRINPAKGEPWVCNDKHILTLFRKGRKSHENAVVDIQLSDYLNLSTSLQRRYNLLRVDIDPHVMQSGCRIAQKSASSRSSKNMQRTNFTVEPIGEGDYYGFTLDGDGRFLLGDFTVTHNSTLAATFPRPMLVIGFDERTKMEPYLAGGFHHEEDIVYLDEAKTRPVFVQKVRDEAGTPESLVRIEQFYEVNPERPQAWESFRLYRLHEFKADKWATIVIDSATSIAAAARYWDQLTQNRGAGDKRQHWGAAREQLEWLFRTAIPSWIRSNVVVIAHVSKPTGLDNTRKPAMPGQLTNDVGGAFGEVYRAFVERAKDGSLRHVLQTRITPEYTAGTMIKAGGTSGLCAPSYEALWAHYQPPVARAAPKVDLIIPDLVSTPYDHVAPQAPGADDPA